MLRFISLLNISRVESVVNKTLSLIKVLNGLATIVSAAGFVCSTLCLFHILGFLKHLP